MKAHRKSEGFTVIELMVSMIAFSVLAIAVGSMLYYGWLGWRRSTDSVAFQRDAMIAMRVVEHRIRSASLDSLSSRAVSWNSSQLTFASDADFSSSDLAFDSGVVFVPGSFNIQSNEIGGVSVEFALRNASATDEASYEMTIYPRN
jgi:prepilin-type N-terminal cleavage/methylation domain-containing protein